MKTSTIFSIIIVSLLIACNVFQLQAQDKRYGIYPRALDVGAYDYSKVKKCPYKIYYEEEAEEKFNERLMSDERLRNFKPFAEYIAITQEDGSIIYVREQEAYEFCPELEYVMITGGHGFVRAYDLRTLEEIFVNPSSYVYSPSGKYRFGTFEYDGMDYYIEVKEGDKYMPYGIGHMSIGFMTGVYWVDDETIHYLSEKELADGSKYWIGYSTKFYESTGENTPLECTQAQDTSSDWRRQQASLRNEILSRKENNVLKNSFLQELYIRDVVRAHGDSVTLFIPFDLHSFYNCGAPDCYSTDVSFGFKLGDRLEFPPEVQFTEHEHGCVEQETRISGIFHLTAQTDDHVIYHSPEHGRTLVLFREYESVRTYAYYFTNANTVITEASVTSGNVYRIEKGHIEDGSADQIYPFKSTKLSRFEYEVPIRN